MKLKEKVQTIITVISCSLCIMDVGMVEADSYLLLIPTLIILLINTILLIKYGR